MNDSCRGQILASLFKNENFNKGRKSHRLVLLYIVSECLFDGSHVVRKGHTRPSTFGECSLTFGELIKSMETQFSKVVLTRAINWACNEFFLCTTSTFQKLCTISDEYRNKGVTPIENMCTPLLTTRLNEFISYEPPLCSQRIELTVHNSVTLGPIAICDLKNIRYIPQKPVENPVHNLCKFKFTATRQKSPSTFEPKNAYLSSLRILLYSSSASPSYFIYKIPKLKQVCDRTPEAKPGFEDPEPPAPEPPAQQTKTPVLSPQNGISVSLVETWIEEFPSLNVLEELELFEEELQLLESKRHNIRDLKSYTYGYLSKRNSEECSPRQYLDDDCPFIGLEKEVESRSCPALYWMNYPDNELDPQANPPLTAYSERELSLWTRVSYEKNLPKISHNVEMSELRQPTTVLQTLTCFIRKPSKLLTIQGASGTGKSFISILTTREMFRRKWDFIYISANDLSLVTKRKDSAAIDMQTRLTNVPFLVIEDVCLEIKHYAFVEMLCCVINSRIRYDNRPTLLTTTLKPSSFLKALGIDLADRVAAEPWLILK